jgi:predicted transcriptional regulator
VTKKLNFNLLDASFSRLQQIYYDEAKADEELESQLYLILCFEGAKTRDELVNLTNEARSTIYDALVRLETQDYIERESVNNGKDTGRNNIYWQVKLF